MTINRTIVSLFLIVNILLSAGFVNMQKPNYITLQDEKLNFIPAGFYIADVSDERPAHSVLAEVVYKYEAHSYVAQSEDMQGGVAISIKQFIGRNLTRNAKLKPVAIAIKTLRLTETSMPGNRVSGQLSVDFSFGLQYDYGAEHLVDYKTLVHYERPDNQPASAEIMLRKKIEDALDWFNSWMNLQADKDPRLAKAVKVDFSDYTEAPESDTVYYSAKRPLTWADFHEGALGNNYDAEVFTSIGYTEKTEVVKGVIQVYLSIKTDLPKNDCLVRPGGQTSAALNHEQRHFDIAKIVAERFKHKIAAMHLPVDNYDGPINVEYLETLRELTAMQKQYDGETRHGTDMAVQAEWNEKIDKELATDGVKK